MDTMFVIREISSSLYVGEENLVSIDQALEFNNIEEAEDILVSEIYQTGYYEIIKVYFIDVEARREQEEYDDRLEHINEMKQCIQKYGRIQNGEGTNWVGYFRYNPEYVEKTKRWFNNSNLEDIVLKKNKYYKVTGWDNTVEEVDLEYVTEHIRQYTLETGDKWISSQSK